MRPTLLNHAEKLKISKIRWKVLWMTYLQRLIFGAVTIWAFPFMFFSKYLIELIVSWSLELIVAIPFFFYKPFVRIRKMHGKFVRRRKFLTYGRAYKGTQYYYDSNGRLGNLAENRVSKYLNAYLPRNFRSLHNVRYSTDNLNAQIDHIVISPAGIHVIETKNIAGEITGGIRKNTWRRVPFENQKFEPLEFENPIKQNEHHIKVLKETLSSDYAYYNVILFLQKASKLKLRNPAKSYVITELPKLLQRIYDDCDNCESRLTNEQIENLYYTLCRTAKNTGATMTFKS